MRLRLELDLTDLDNPAREAARILRYWTVAVGEIDLEKTAGYALLDSEQREIGRLAIADGGADGEVKTWFQEYLRSMHRALLYKLDDLGERDARWPMTPTGTNVLGVVKHVASVEVGYLGEVMGRPFPEPMPWFDDEHDADLWATEQETIGSVRAFAERAWAHADATVSELDLHARGFVPWWLIGDVTLGRILVHVALEVSQHLGQLDVVRELIDGRVGADAQDSNQVWRDPERWSNHVDRLKRMAESAGRAAGDGAP